MGWWGYGITDGDGPLDTLIDIEEANPTTSEELMKVVGIDENTLMDDEVGTVVGFYAIENTLEISDLLKRKILESVEYELNEAESFCDTDQRTETLIEFRDQLNTYCDRQK